MIMFIIGVLVIIGSLTGVMCAIGMKHAKFTPGRRTRGLARWWARCTRWTHRLGINNRETVTSTLHPVPWAMTREKVITARQMQQIGRAVAGVNDRPTPAEFAAAPLYGHTLVDRLLKDLDTSGGR